MQRGHCAVSRFVDTRTSANQQATRGGIAGARSQEQTGAFARRGEINIKLRDGLPPTFNQRKLRITTCSGTLAQGPGTQGEGEAFGRTAMCAIVQVGTQTIKRTLTGKTQNNPIALKSNQIIERECVCLVRTMQMDLLSQGQFSIIQTLPMPHLPPRAPPTATRCAATCSDFKSASVHCAKWSDLQFKCVCCHQCDQCDCWNRIFAQRCCCHGHRFHTDPVTFFLQHNEVTKRCFFFCFEKKRKSFFFFFFN
jgi:hypothetical protein